MLRFPMSHFLSAKEVRVALGRRGRTDERRDQEISENLWWLLGKEEKDSFLGSSQRDHPGRQPL